MIEKNEVVVLEEVKGFNRALAKNRKDAGKTYPLPTALRQELKDLKSNQLGGLKSRLHTIKTLKYEEYCEANKNEINDLKEEFDSLMKEFEEESLNIFNEFYEKTLELRDKEKVLKEKIPALNVNCGYQLRQIQNGRDKSSYISEVSIDDKKFKDKVLKAEFEDKFGEDFSLAEERVALVENSFNEAVLFGDLEMVKEIYTIMKSADAFLDRVSELEVQK